MKKTNNLIIIIITLFSSILISDSLVAQTIPVQVTNEPNWASHAAWSSDGTKIVYEANRNNNRDIYTITLSDSSVERITDHYADDFQPDWNPTINEIVFFSDRGNNTDIQKKDLTSNVLTRLTTHTAFDITPKYSFDGTMIAFVSERSGDIQIWTIPAQGGTPNSLTTDGGQSPCWSPDGTQIAFISSRSGRDEVWIIPSVGGTATPLTTCGAGFCSWSPDGSEIAFHNSTGIWVIPSTGGDPTNITQIEGFNADWSPDGEKLAFEYNNQIWTVNRNLTSIENENHYKMSLKLHNNFPNPFNSSTIISYSIPNSNFVTLKIYDILGREIQTLVNEVQKADTYSVSFDAGKLSSGIYFYGLQVGSEFVETKRMLLIK